MNNINNTDFQLYDILRFMPGDTQKLFMDGYKESGLSVLCKLLSDCKNFVIGGDCILDILFGKTKDMKNVDIFVISSKEQKYADLDFIIKKMLEQDPEQTIEVFGNRIIFHFHLFDHVAVTIHTDCDSKFDVTNKYPFSLGQIVLDVSKLSCSFLLGTKEFCQTVSSNLITKKHSWNGDYFLLFDYLDRFPQFSTDIYFDQSDESEYQFHKISYEPIEPTQNVSVERYKKYLENNYRSFSTNIPLFYDKNYTVRDIVEGLVSKRLVYSNDTPEESESDTSIESDETEVGSPNLSVIHPEPNVSVIHPEPNVSVITNRNEMETVETTNEQIVPKLKRSNCLLLAKKYEKELILTRNTFQREFLFIKNQKVKMELLYNNPSKSKYCADCLDDFDLGIYFMGSDGKLVPEEKTLKNINVENVNNTNEKVKKISVKKISFFFDVEDSGIYRIQWKQNGEHNYLKEHFIYIELSVYYDDNVSETDVSFTETICSDSYSNSIYSETDESSNSSFDKVSQK